MPFTHQIPQRRGGGSQTSMSIIIQFSLEAKQGWPALSLDGRPAGAGKGWLRPEGGAHPSGPGDIPNALRFDETCLLFERLK